MSEPLTHRSSRNTLVAPASPAVASPAASPAAAVAATSARAAPPAFGPRLRLVDGQSAAAHVLAVQGGGGSLRLLLRLHLHEAEAFGAAGVPVHDHLRGLHRAVRFEHLGQLAVGHAVAQVADV